jgi:peptide/nickel transport system substrate-binding protein
MPTFSGRKTRRDFLRDGAVLGAAAFGGGALLEACGTGTSSSKPTSSGKPTRKNTLFIGGYQWGPPTSFNPFGGNSAWPTGPGPESGYSHIYETLFGFNLLDGTLRPGLGKSVSYPDQTTAVVSLYQEAHFADGKPVTADDVLYTFELAKNHTDLNHAEFWTYVSGMTKKDDHTVQLTFNGDNLNPGQVQHFLAYQPIVPKHLWTSVEAQGGSLLNYALMNPVGSGPYKLHDANQQQVVLIRDDGWWGTSVFGAVAPAYITHPILKDNDAANLAFQNGELDYSQTFAPQIWLMWQQKNLPVGTWYSKEPYYVPGQIPMIFINVHKKGLDNPKVRQAIAYSIDYAKIAATAMSSYSIPVNASLIIPDGAEKRFFDSSGVSQTGWKTDTAKAVQILEQDLGARKGSDGIYVLPDGTRLGPWKAQCPSGWTDWQATLQVVSDSAKALGIDIQTFFPEQTVDIPALQNGDFDIGMYSARGADPASPWARLHDALQDKGVPAAGQTAFWDYGRFSDPAGTAQGLLTQAAAASKSQQPQLFAQLDDLFRKNIPVIPMLYRPLEFYQYNQSVWSGFPNSSNPYAPPSQQGAGIRMLSRIKVKS